MTVRHVASNAQRFAVCAPMRLPATVRLPFRFASCAQISVTGVLNNVASKRWITANDAPIRVVVALRHAAKWPLESPKYGFTYLRLAASCLI